MERVLGGLGERSEQDEDEGDRHGGPRRWVAEDGAQLVRACGLTQHDEAGEHGEAAGPGDQQCLERGRSGPRVGVAVADEQEGRHRRELPEAVQHQEVVGHHESGHRPAEQHEQSDETSRWLVEVARRVSDDEHADAGDEDEHQRGEAVDT